jgi:hypothetical protein
MNNTNWEIEKNILFSPRNGCSWYLIYYSNSVIYDPIHWRLIEENRAWCVHLLCKYLIQFDTFCILLFYFQSIVLPSEIFKKKLEVILKSMRKTIYCTSITNIQITFGQKKNRFLKSLNFENTTNIINHL